MKNKHYKIMVTCVLILMMMISIIACGGKTGSDKQGADKPTNSPSTAADSGSSKQAVDPKAEIEKLVHQVQKGPNGETIDATSLEVTDEDIQKLKEKKVTAAISLHYGGNDWSNSALQGMKDQFAKMGIEVVAVTDANFEPNKQTSDIESIMATKPDILVSIPTDTVSVATPYKKAAAQGAKVILFDQPPQGLKYGVDYSTVIVADEYNDGVISAHQMALALGGKGKIGIIYHEADLVVTKRRYEGFKKTIQEKYPDITIAQEQGIAGPDFAGDANKTASAFLLKDPEIKGIWGVWDVPAEGIMEAARNAGRDKDLVITTCDLGKNVAIEMAKGGMIKGIGAPIVYDAGVAAAKAGALAVLGKTTPEFLMLNSVASDKSNVLEAWKKTFHVDPPKELTDALK